MKMGLRLLIDGACEDIRLPCGPDTFYADATSCDHYYRCQGYRIWRNRCPSGTVSMKKSNRPCTGRSWQCNPNKPRQRCKNTTTISPQDDCSFRFSLPCETKTTFLDPSSCGHYLTCLPVEQGEVMGRKPCSVPARCDLMQNNRHCTSDGEPKCGQKKTIVIGKRADTDIDDDVMTNDDSSVDHTSLIIGLVMATIIIALIVGFLILIFHKRKQKKKKPPPSLSLPTLTISDPIPITEPCTSSRYSGAQRPVSSLTYSQPNEYSAIADKLPEGPCQTWGETKDQCYSNPDNCNIYEDIDMYHMDTKGSSENLTPPSEKTAVVSPDLGPRRPLRNTANRPWSQSFEVPSRRPVTRAFSLTSLSTPRPPLEPPRDSWALVDQGYSNPYFILPEDPGPSSPGTPTRIPLVSPTSDYNNSHKYFVLEKGSTDLETDNVSMGTTYCEIDDAHVLDRGEDLQNTSFI